MAQWKFDPPHSSAEFSVRHLGVAWVRGRFMKMSGLADFELDNPEVGSVEVSIDAASINTGDEKRDNHLRSADFFDVAREPVITFKSTSVKKGEGAQYEVTGDLTMRGITKSVALVLTFLGSRAIPSGEGAAETRAGFMAKITINRHDFGISWDMPLAMGVTMVGGEVDVTLNVEAIKQ